MQKKLCRPVPLEMIGSLTVATLRELAAEAGSKGGRSAAAAVPEAESAPEEAAAQEEQVSAATAEPVSKKVSVLLSRLSSCGRQTKKLPS